MIRSGTLRYVGIRPRGAVRHAVPTCRARYGHFAGTDRAIGLMCVCVWFGDFLPKFCLTEL